MNKIYYSHHHQSWIGDTPKKDSYIKISFRTIQVYSAFIVSGINKERADTKLTKILLKQIESWSSICEDQPIKVFNPDLGAFRYIPQSFAQK